MYFQYHSEFLDSVYYTIDPKHLSKTSDLKTFHSGKEAPGFIDDVLSDDWGKKVLARVHHLSHKPSILVSYFSGRFKLKRYIIRFKHLHSKVSNSFNPIVSVLTAHMIVLNGGISNNPVFISNGRWH